MSAIVLPRFGISISLALTVICASGCQSPWFSRSEVNHIGQSPPVVSDATQTKLASQVKPAGEVTATVSSPTDDGPKNEQEALAEVSDQLKAIEAVDSKAKQRLMADLKKNKPDHWPLMVQQFRSALAYRNQLLARDLPSDAGMPTALLASAPSRTLEAPLPERSKGSAPVLATQASYPSTGAAAVVATSEEPKSQVKKPHVTEGSPAEADREVTNDLSPPDSKSLQSTRELSAPPPSNTTSKVFSPPENKPTEIAQPHSANHTTNVNSRKRIEQTTFSASVYESPDEYGASGWQSDLRRSIAALKQATSESPSSTQEVQQHMQLRLLYLLAGQENSAYQPVPGATAAQQDYWSNQLFAVSTFLDNGTHPDGKQRAAATLIHLDQARSKLAELGPLQVRNLTFVESVDGYGIYKPLANQTFRPGQQVTLYVEVQNFRSEPTPDGQRSSLGTSYQVLDEQGHRVDAGQFPEVEDLCKSVRHDFHIQYGVALPTRIYPGKYELRLNVTDNLSNKLGQTSVPFEILKSANP